MKTYAGLSKKQAVLYQQKVSALREALEQPVSQMERRGLILASIVTFKQICNHPDQYTGQTGLMKRRAASSPACARSAKPSMRNASACWSSPSSAS